MDYVAIGWAFVTVIELDKVYNNVAISNIWPALSLYISYRILKYTHVEATWRYIYYALVIISTITLIITLIETIRRYVS